MSENSDQTPLPRISETVLKHKKSLKQIEHARKEKRAVVRKKKRGEPSRIKFTPAQKFVKAYRCQQRTRVQMSRAAVKPLFMDEQERLLLIVRVRDNHGETPQTLKILQFLHVRQLYSAAFMLSTKKVWKMLRLVEPFVAWGYPSLQTVKELIYKRGYGRVDKQRVALTDNKLIEDVLGKHNIICTEDIVHELFNCGPAFKEVNKFLWPFKLNPAKGAFVKDAPNNHECGNHKSEIDDMIKKMN